MSEQGDVVWANGKSWQRDNLLNPHDKKWWINPDGVANLKELKAFKDFRWLVKDGELNSALPAQQAALAYNLGQQNQAEKAAASFRGLVAERDEWQVDARKLRDERDKVWADRNLVVNELADMTEARDAAAKGYLEKVSELEDIRAELSGWSIWKTDEPEPPLAEQVRTLRDAWRDVANERDNAKRILLDKTAFEEEVTKAANEERAAIVAWLRGIWPTCYARDYADDIERGEHLQDAPTEPKGPCGVPGFACFCCEPKGHEGAHVCGCSTVPHAIGESDE